ncbi:MAG: FtsW/RodA/SpoVE family cell cycle protein [Lachnospiraceae bacterium]|nr:FtsW/RodA/SpoVE family cell cycle protein [Lachnospiraceae bacterium]
MLDQIFRSVLDWIQSFTLGNSFFENQFRIITEAFFPMLSLFILAGAVFSLLTIPKIPEIWGKLVSQKDGRAYFITHWENIIGRHKSSDIIIKDPRVSRQHAALIRSDKGSWKLLDLGAGDSHGIFINGEEIIDKESKVRFGDTISFSGYTVKLEPLTVEEKKQREKRRNRVKPIPPWALIILLTIIQVMAALSLVIDAGAVASIYIIPSFFILTVVMWMYFIDLRILGVQGFEMEIIGFYLSTLSLAVVGSYAPSSMMKQAISILVGVFFLIAFGLFLRNLNRVQTFRWIMAAATIGLLGATVVFGSKKYGAINWVEIKGVSLQLSEIAKLTYIFAGAATLDRLFKKRNIALFIVLTLASLGLLAYCSDFGTAAIFFITFLVLAYLRSGSISTVAFAASGAAVAALLAITAKPYIFRRFRSWGRAWDYAASTGYQQMNTQVAINRGGAFGVGPGKGILASKHVAAADTDLVFGMLCEEWGMIIALFAILCIVVLAVFAIRSCINSRSTYYTIAACAATSLLLFQTALNVFGAVDILPLTGVTFPFVSNGGSSMVMAWGTLAFLKATDTRPNASFAARLKRSEQAATIKEKKHNKNNDIENYASYGRLKAIEDSRTDKEAKRKLVKAKPKTAAPKTPAQTGGKDEKDTKQD